LQTPKAPVRKTITFTQRDGWREVVSAQSVYVSRDEKGQLAVCRQSVRTLVAASPGRQVTTSSFAHAMAVSSRRDGQHIFGPPRARWSTAHSAQKTANCKSTLNTSDPMCLTRKKSASAMRVSRGRREKVAVGASGRKSLPKRIFHWLDRRAGLDKLMHESLDEPIPAARG